MGEVLNNMADGIVLNTKDCPVDEALGTDDPNNVFTCKKAEECCTVDLLPACCAEQDIGIAIEQQLKLWIPLLGMIFMLSVFIWFCRTDEACCDVEKPCLYRFGCKKKKKKGEDEPTSESKDDDTKSVTTTVVEEDDNNEQLSQNANELEEKMEGEE